MRKNLQALIGVGFLRGRNKNRKALIRKGLAPHQIVEVRKEWTRI